MRQTRIGAIRMLWAYGNATTWTIAPGPHSGGSFVKAFNRMDQGRPINLGGGRVLLMSRTREGHLCVSWSNDDGKTWSEPKRTMRSLVCYVGCGLGIRFAM